MNIHRSAPLRSDNFWLKGFDIDAGVYSAVAEEGKTLSMKLEEVRAQEREPTIYLGLTKAEVIRKRLEMKKAGIESPLTALEECFKQLGIQTTGAYTDFVGKFYETSGGAVVFPEYWSDRIYAGILKRSIVSEFAMSENVITGDNFHKVYLETVERDRQLSRVGEYEEFPEVKIVVAEQSVTIQNFGTYVTISYKAMRQQRLGIFSKGLEQIGQQIDVDRCDDMVRTIRLGDGNSNTPTTTVETDATGTISTADVVEWANCLPTPYIMDKFVTRKALHNEYCTTLSDFDNPIATWGFMGISLPRAFEWDRSSVPTDNFLGVDSQFAIEHITNGAVLVESENIIRKQIKGTAVSHADCFTIFTNDATAIFDETH